MKIYCKKCNALLKPGAKFCSNCGEKIANETICTEDCSEKGIYCPNCGVAINNNEAKFCPACGFSFKKIAKNSDTVSPEETVPPSELESVTEDEPVYENNFNGRSDNENGEQASETSAKKIFLENEQTKSISDNLSLQDVIQKYLPIPVFAIILFLAIVYARSSNSDSLSTESEQTIGQNYIDMVKGCSLYSIYPDVETSDAFDAFFTRQEWEYFISTDDQQIVQVTGDYTLEGEPAEMVVQFLLTPDEDEDGLYYITLYAMEIKGTAISSALAELQLSQIISEYNDSLQDDNSSVSASNEIIDSDGTYAGEESVEQYYLTDTVTGDNLTVHTHCAYHLTDNGCLSVYVICSITNNRSEVMTFNSYSYFSLNNDGIISNATSSYDYTNIAPGTEFETTVIFTFPDNSNTDFENMTMTVDGIDICLEDKPQEDTMTEFAGIYHNEANKIKYFIENITDNRYRIFAFYSWNRSGNYDDFEIELNDNSFTIPYVYQEYKCTWNSSNSTISFTLPTSAVTLTKEN